MQDVGCYAASTARTWINPRVRLASPSSSLSRAPPPINLLPWAYPSVDCQPHIVDSGAPCRGCACRSHGELEGHLPCFHEPPGGPNIHGQDVHLDHWHGWHCRSHRGGAGSSCANQIYTSTGGSDPGITLGVVFFDNSSTASPLLREVARQLRSDRVHRSGHYRPGQNPNLGRVNQRSICWGRLWLHPSSPD
jgi:hypothetical protein